MAEKIIIASGKGGVGKSSLTAGLSRALCAMGNDVLMVDMDIGLRSLDLIFGVERNTVFDWGNVIDSECDVDRAIMQTDGPDLITAPMNFSDSFTPEAMKAFVDEIEEDYDYIFFDAPAGLSTGFELSCAVADRGIVVSTPDEVCVRSVNLTASCIRRFGIDDVRLVINRFAEKAVRRGKLLNIDDVIDATCVRLMGIVPEDPTVAHCAVRGTALPASSQANKAFLRVAYRICGIEVPLFGP
ncbi:MAG: P-loop NTPase [Clostridia bacterium]|nr:P-loop NTPase [Clostridia bacterium]